MRIIINGAASEYRIPDGIREKCIGMSLDISKYFFESAESVLLPIDLMILTRAREEGICSSIHKMKEAAEGRRLKRNPILIREHEEDYLVIDGNSTVVILKAIGIQSVRAIVKSR